MVFAEGKKKGKARCSNTVVAVGEARLEKLEP